MKNSRSSLKIALAAIAAGVLFNLPGWFVPQLTQGVIAHFQLSAAKAGLIPTGENLLAGIISLILARRNNIDGLRHLSIAAMLAWFCGNVATYPAVHYASGPVPLLLCRILTGCGTGTLIYISSTLAAHTPKPDRTFGQVTIAGNGFAAFILSSLPWLRPGGSPIDVFPYGGLLALVWFPLLLLRIQPQHQVIDRGTSDPVDQPMTRVSPLIVGALIVALNTANTMNLSNFIFAEPLGVRTGLSQGTVQVAMGLSVMLSTVGAILVQFLPRRAGHLVPLTIALLAFFAANYLLTVTSSPILFRVSLAASEILGFFVVPLFLGWSAYLDPSGRTSAILNSCYVVVYAICPAAAGLLVDRFSLGALPIQSIVLSTTAIAMVLLIGFVQRRSAPHNISSNST